MFNGKIVAPFLTKIAILFSVTLFAANVLHAQVSTGTIVGTVVDIRSPAFVTGINQVGHHYHFVSDGLKSGSHSLSFTIGAVTVEIQTLRPFSLWLPNDEPFIDATLPYIAN